MITYRFNAAYKMIDIYINKPASKMIDIYLNKPAYKMIDIYINEPGTAHFFATVMLDSNYPYGEFSCSEVLSVKKTVFQEVSQFFCPAEPKTSSKGPFGILGLLSFPGNCNVYINWIDSKAAQMHYAKSRCN